jgi:hypothetical protein
VLGVARNVLREEVARQGRETALRQRWPVDAERALKATEAVAAPSDEARRLACLTDCLHRLGPETRRLVLDYHRGEKRHRIERRRLLAEALGVTSVALRVRMHRVRQTVESCVRGCLQRDGVTPSLRKPPPHEG